MRKAKFVNFVNEVIRPLIPVGHRMLFDLSTTSEPDDGTFYQDDLRKNYSLRQDVLISVINFLEMAQAPVQMF